MLDLARLQRLKLSRRPRSQRFFGTLLGLNYHWLPGVELVLEGSERLPDPPVIFAMNHTDRYNYFPFQYEIASRRPGSRVNTTNVPWWRGSWRACCSCRPYPGAT